MSNIGMMDGAFFVGRKEIIDWINQTLNLNLTKVEQTASGAIACQLLDMMYPGKNFIIISIIYFIIFRFLRSSPNA